MLVLRLIHTYLVIGALTVAGLLSVVSPASGSAMIEPRSCAPTPEAAGIRLVVAPDSVIAGQSVHYRVDNRKGPTITYGADYSIQECVAGVWMLAPFSPTVFPKQKIAQLPSRGRWWRVPIPTTAAAGEYRVRKSVNDGMRGRWLYDGFDVVADTSARQAGAPRNPPGASPTAK